MTRVDYGNAMVCVDGYFAHHYGATKVEREATDDESDKYERGYGYERELMGLVFEETEFGLLVTEWFAGESDTRCEGGEPLRRLEGYEVSDNTCSNHYYGQSCEKVDDIDSDNYGENVEPCEHCGSSDDETGIHEFSWSSCGGCGSHLGGSRYRLHLTKEE
jgi:hypothetical protein